MTDANLGPEVTDPSLGLNLRRRYFRPRINRRVLEVTPTKTLHFLYCRDGHHLGVTQFLGPWAFFITNPLGSVKLELNER